MPVVVSSALVIARRGLTDSDLTGNKSAADSCFLSVSTCGNTLRCDDMQTGNQYDAIVIGAGPAGSTAAYLLASSGRRVLIIDKQGFPRPKLCGGLITRKTVKVIGDVFHTDVETLGGNGAVVYESSRYAVCNHHRKSIEGTLDFPFHFVDRSRYDHHLLKFALAAGARSRTPTRAVAVDPATNTVETLDDKRYRGRFIIAADGALSRVRAALAHRCLFRERQRPGLAQSIEIKLPEKQSTHLPDYPRIYFGHLPWGYAWSFPGPGYQLLGMAGLRAGASDSLRSRFRGFLDRLSVSLPETVHLQAAYLPYGNYLKTPGWGTILLVGDAAGLADPLLGEGIYYAHQSAKLAAEAIIAADREPAAALEIYTNDLAVRTIRDLRYARAGRNLVYALPQQLYYPVLTAFLRVIRKPCEETIQGMRTFAWFRAA